MSNSSACLPLQRPCPCTCWESRLVPTAPCSCCSVPKTKTKNSFCVTSTCLENLFLLSVLHSAPCHLYTLTHKHMLAHCVDFCSRKKSNRGNYFVINPSVYFTEKFSVETLLIIHSIPNHKLAKAVPLINSFLHKWIATISFHIYFSLWCLLGNVLKGNFHLR